MRVEWTRIRNLILVHPTRIYRPMKMKQSVPKRRHINSRRRVITQKKAYRSAYSSSEVAAGRQAILFDSPCVLDNCKSKKIIVHEYSAHFLYHAFYKYSAAVRQCSVTFFIELSLSSYYLQLDQKYLYSICLSRCPTVTLCGSLTAIFHT